MDLTTALSQHYGLTEEELQFTINQYRPMNMSAKDFFLKEGQISDKLAYIKTGLFRTYSYDKRGDELTLNFHEPGTILLSPESFNKKIPAKENIVAIDDAELLYIDYEGMQTLYNQIPVWRQICMEVAEFKNQQLVERSIQFQTLSAKERYERFCKEHPLVCQRAAVGHIASYLGIDIATLSRIRKKIVF